MEIKKTKCSSKEHQDIDAISYCCICKLKMCNKCGKLHNKLFSSHKIVLMNKNDDEIFTGLCKEKSHNEELKFLCKDHNVLCCSSCINN